MHRVLIVDDELLVRTNLKRMLDWEAAGFAICGEAANGTDALAAIDKTSPDIIISDIRMPVMDGFELSDHLKQSYPNVALIVLSNYDDFKYVKGTLKNGAIDYILKHNLNSETLSEALQRAKEHIEKSKGSLLPKQYSTNNLLALREKFLIQLLSGSLNKEEEIKDQLHLLDLKLGLKNILAVIMVIDDYNVVSAKGALQDLSLLEFTIINISEEILDDSGNGAICHVSNEKYVFIFSFENIHSANVINSFLISLLSRISVCLKKFMNISVSFSIGPQYNSILNIIKSYEGAEKMLEKRFYEGKNCILNAPATDKASTSITGLKIEIEKKIVTDLHSPDRNILLKTLNNVFHEIKMMKLPLIHSQIIFGDLLSIVNRACKDNSLDQSKIFANKEAPYIILSKMETLEDVRSWLTAVFSKLNDEINTYKFTESYSNNVIKAIDYIRKHYSEDITLASVANEINLSSVYLSKVFKKETGKGFAEYLCDLRLTKAKLLIEEGKENIKNIINLCGFNNYEYFFKVFKQKTGITPKEFIKHINNFSYPNT